MERNTPNKRGTRAFGGFQIHVILLYKAGHELYTISENFVRILAAWSSRMIAASGTFPQPLALPFCGRPRVQLPARPALFLMSLMSFPELSEANGVLWSSRHVFRTFCPVVVVIFVLLIPGGNHFIRVLFRNKRGKYDDTFALQMQRMMRKTGLRGKREELF